MTDANQTPALPSTADTTPYVPVSWMAVSAATVSGLFLVILAVLGLWDFFKEKKPLLLKEILILPAIGLVLSYAGRRMIRNSEGTRTGEKLVNAAWWGSVVGGLGFGAYLVAIDYSIHRDATNEVEKWVDYILKDDASDPKRPNLNRAFMATLPPDRRRSMFADEPDQFMTEYRDSYLTFKDCDLVRLVQRNKGECQFVSDGVKEWMERPYGVECLFSGTLKCPEGTFPLQIPMRGAEGLANSQGTRRQWLLAVPSSGLFVQSGITRTPYGWAVENLEQSGIKYGMEFMRQTGNGPTGDGPNAFFPEAYQLMIASDSKLPFWTEVKDSIYGRWAVGGAPAIFAPFMTPAAVKYFQDDFFKLPGGGEPSLDQKNQFKKAWDLLGLLPPGMRLKNNTDKFPTTSIAENAIEVRLPLEMALPSTDISGVHCRLILKCTDPAIIADVKRLRAEAKPDQGTSLRPSNLQLEKPKWRVVRVESDMVPLVSVTPPRPGNQTPHGMPGG